MDVFSIAEGEVLVDLVGQDEEILLHAELGKRGERGAGEDRSSRVVRSIDDDHGSLIGGLRVKMFVWFGVSVGLDLPASRPADWA